MNKLPQLPSALAFLQSLSQEEVLKILGDRPWEAISLIDALCQEGGWLQVQKTFIANLFSLLFLQVKKAAQLRLPLAERMASLVHTYPDLLLPYFPKNLTIQIKGVNSYQTNALLFSLVSPFFHSLLHRADLFQESVCIDVEGDEESFHTLRYVEELAFYGTAKQLWYCEEKELVQALHDAKRWGIEKLKTESARALSRFFQENSICHYIAMAQENRWESLKKEALLYVNSLQMGAELYLPYGGTLGVLFHDYRQEAIEFFEKLNNVVTHLGFMGDIIEDSRFSAIVNSASSLKGVKLIMTTRYSERIFTIPTAIEELSLDMCAWLTEENLTKIAKAFPHIQRLDVSRNSHLNYRIFAVFSQFLCLKELNLSRLHHLRDDELKMICQGNPSLNVLILEGCTSLTDKGFEQVGLYLKNLRGLNLARTSISDIGLIALVTKITSLRALSLEGCKAISSTAVKEVIRRENYLENFTPPAGPERDQSTFLPNSHF